MTRHLLALCATALLLPGGSLLMPIDSHAREAGQQTAPKPPAPPPAPPPEPARPPAPPPEPPPPVPDAANVQLEVVITDTISGKPEAKRVTLLVRAGQRGSIRTQGVVAVPRAVQSTPDDTPVVLRQEPEVGVELALDGSVQLMDRDLVNVNVTFSYAAPPSVGTANAELREVHPPRVSESLSVVLRSGRPLLVSRSADPATNRTVSVELTATIMEP